MSFGRSYFLPCTLTEAAELLLLRHISIYKAMLKHQTTRTSLKWWDCFWRDYGFIVRMSDRFFLSNLSTSHTHQLFNHSVATVGDLDTSLILSASKSICNGFQILSSATWMHRQQQVDFKSALWVPFSAKMRRGFTPIRSGNTMMDRAISSLGWNRKNQSIPRGTRTIVVVYDWLRVSNIGEKVCGKGLSGEESFVWKFCRYVHATSVTFRALSVFQAKSSCSDYLSLFCKRKNTCLSFHVVWFSLHHWADYLRVKIPAILPLNGSHGERDSPNSPSLTAITHRK